MDKDDLVERLLKPIDADALYKWIRRTQKASESDLWRQGFENSMALIDEEREEAAAEIRSLRAQVAQEGKT